MPGRGAKAGPSRCSLQLPLTKGPPTPAPASRIGWDLHPGHSQCPILQSQLPQPLELGNLATALCFPAWEAQILVAEILSGPRKEIQCQGPALIPTDKKKRRKDVEGRQL